ncbi:MAG: SRPBCC family protein [Solirubrobacteraceae bacterium]
MATAQKARTIAAPPQQVWEILEDPQHMSRWWPGVKRMEAVQEDRWTQVHTTKRGRSVRADFRLLQSEPPWYRAWEQEIVGTPFERVLNESITEISLEPEGEGTRVTIAQRQKLRGYSRTGGLMLRRATAKQLSEALESLERLFG